MGETKDCYLIGLGHTDLVIQANNPPEALKEARHYRDNKRDILGYHPWAVPYLIQDEEVNGYGHMAELGLAPLVRLIRSRESNPPPLPNPPPNLSLEKAQIKSARAVLASYLGALLETKIMSTVEITLVEDNEDAARVSEDLVHV